MSNLKPGVSEQRFRSVEIKSILRPDYYEFFPAFSDYELVIRSQRMTAVFAAAFMIVNMKRGIELGLWCGSDLKDIFLDDESASRLFRDYVMSVGLSNSVADVFSAVRRRRFVPPKFRGLEWVNESIPFSSRTWLSAPGIVALMLEMQWKLSRSFRRIVELGSGTGFHLSCLRQLYPSASLIGYETNQSAINFSINATMDMEIEYRVGVDQSYDQSVDLVVCTFAMSSELCKSVRTKFPNAYLIRPSEISATEFELGKRGRLQYLGFSDYAGYLGKSHIFRKIEASNPVGQIVDTLYDVRFVSEADAVFADDRYPKDSMIERFGRDLLAHQQYGDHLE